MNERGATKLDLMLFGGEPTLYLRQCVRLLEGASSLGLGQRVHDLQRYPAQARCRDGP